MSSSPNTFDLEDDLYDEPVPSNEAAGPRGRLWKILLPVIVLLVAAGGTAALFNAREEPPRTERKSLGPLVETLDAVLSDVRLEVSGHGEVNPRIDVELLPEVPGKVTWVHPNLHSGGRFTAGETLVRIDDRDYRLAVERAAAAIARAETTLQREQAEADAARQEWNAMNGDETPPDLLVRGPQIRQVQAELAAAQADLRAAELNLDRTRLSLPFDGIVVSESVSPGQYVAQGRALATVYGTDAVEIRVPLSDGELAWFDAAGSAHAEVTADLAGGSWAWKGVVERLEGQVDPRSRMVHVVVRVDSPFDPSADVGETSVATVPEGDFRSDPSTRTRPPLLPGTFVEVAIDGHTLQEVVELPRHALREGGVVWAARTEGDDGAERQVLRLREIEVVRTDRTSAFVRGLLPGDRVIVSSLEAPVDGMTVRPAERAEASS
ncbi:MAG: efflux RND transporter periplasmic adaptor subunit [Thermoanaerobaculia bacterium]|nr:efflux RND transporter periplasmic adaptor subunit [Thermoanaerobaculia bacterium]